ncbi:hypothetical protein FB451DRAFT_1042635 [Mycena latifolia]|nr:hypothetical protein FB451DRAFT_1042635 [Mycena latifolia]
MCPLLLLALDDIEITYRFIEALQNDSLTHPDEYSDPDTLDRIRNPSRDLPEIVAGQRLSIDLFLCGSNASVEMYNSVRGTLLCRYPENPVLSYLAVKHW